ncbi:hypothetical protein OAL38_01050 [bacterium]|nr:hypothetical protein [bacterium]
MKKISVKHVEEPNVAGGAAGTIHMKGYRLSSIFEFTFYAADIETPMQSVMLEIKTEKIK